MNMLVSHLPTLAEIWPVRQSPNATITCLLCLVCQIWCILIARRTSCVEKRSNLNSKSVATSNTIHKEMGRPKSWMVHCGKPLRLPCILVIWSRAIGSLFYLMHCTQSDHCFVQQQIQRTRLFNFSLRKVGSESAGSRSKLCQESHPFQQVWPSCYSCYFITCKSKLCPHTTAKWGWDHC